MPGPGIADPGPGPGIGAQGSRYAVRFQGFKGRPGRPGSAGDRIAQGDQGINQGIAQGINQGIAQGDQGMPGNISQVKKNPAQRPGFSRQVGG